MDFAKVFHDAQLPYVEIGNWRARVRPGTFAPEGALIHHTASTDFDGTLKIVRDGRGEPNPLLGPLCNIYVARGKLHIVSAGRANHAGSGSSHALANLRAGKTPPGTAKQMGWKDDFNGGNGLFVGFEVLSPGTGPKLSTADWEITAHGALAVIKAIHHDTRAAVIGHAEWTSRKIDPQFGYGRDAHLNMEALRSRIADIAHGG